MDIATRRQKAWVGDAILSLYAREWILRETGETDGELHTRITSNQFLATLGNPTRIEARIGVLYEEKGLLAAFDWMDHELLPRFQTQLAKRQPKRR